MTILDWVLNFRWFIHVTSTNSPSKSQDGKTTELWNIHGYAGTVIIASVFLKIHGDSSDSTISVSENQSDKNGSIFLKINRWDHIETPIYI